jgi:alpha-glucosidase
MRLIIHRDGGALLCAALLVVSAAMPGMAADIAPASRLEVTSPDGHISVSVTTRGSLSYRVTVDGVRVLEDSALGLRFKDGLQLGSNVTLLNSRRDESNGTWTNPLGKRRVVTDRHRELRLNFSAAAPQVSGFSVVFRVFDDGVAFRYVLPATAARHDFVLEEEQTQFVFAVDSETFAGDQVKIPPTQYDSPGGFAGAQEWEYRRQRLSDLSVDTVTGLPALVHTPAAWLAITEADLYDWAGMWLVRDAPRAGSTAVALRTRLAPRHDGNGVVQASLPHDSPWRVLMIGRTPGALVESDLVLNLSTPSKIADASWVVPGLSSWDPWFSNLVVKDTTTMKDYISLASEMRWPYQLIDGSWYVNRQTPAADITKPVPNIDMDELRRFAAEKHVRLWLWLYWTDVDRNDSYIKAFELYEKWGIAGVKIDFIDRDDQDIVNWYEKIVRSAAVHHLMVDFHGAYKPTGMIRTWPNQITREGIMGNEYNKWSTRVTPEHRVTLPFTRFLAGPGDFTPGGFVNRNAANFQTRKSPSQVLGTRAAELALFVVYDSPLVVVADHPSTIRGQPGMDFLQGGVPTVWDDTRVLSGMPAEYIVIARRAGAQWYLAALTNSLERVKSVKLDFLGSGKWRARWWRDSIETAQDAEHVDIEERTVTAADVLDLHMQPGGGAVLHLIPLP